MDTEVSRLLNFAYFYLRFRPRTEDEMKKYLDKKAKKFSYTEQSVNKAIMKLVDQKLIDDKEFMTWFMEIRSSSKKKSVALLKNELRVRGVPNEVISFYFDENMVDEYEAAIKALRSQWRKFQNENEKKRFQRSANYLQRKGFNYGVIKRAIADLEGKE
ncbi:MAG: regulatory protein RecX [Microgenomates group bacterium]|jgi:regulatory protein|nr:RecX family transcriptional regulator [Candidatus Woesebacteria bacterium]MBP6883043.1 RecX family transcriptional regulator [Candidatus Woesebacteria bacterium]QQR63880.1 MAG: RecX family transcriptional regulator [Candidatus Roizmanbacteria bacterium]